MAGPSFRDLRNISIILFIVALPFTCYRCFARYTKRLWWHDDSVALFSTLSFIICSVGCTYIIDESSSRGKIIGYYLVVAGWCTAVWGTRISIILTVVRITPWWLSKKILLWVAVFFFLEFTATITQPFLVCELTHTEWKQIPGSVCILPQFVPISLAVMTVISDAILIATPLVISRGVRIPALRFRLFSIFSMSIATTLASLVHVVLVIDSPGVWEGISGAVEVAVAIIVCNMSVIIPAVLRALDVGDPFMQEDTVDPNFSSVEIVRMTSTRVELGLPKARSTATTNVDGSDGSSRTVAFQGSVGLGVEDDHKHRLTTQASDVSLGDLKTAKIVPLAGDPDVADSLTQVRNLPGGTEVDLKD